MFYHGLCYLVLTDTGKNNIVDSVRYAISLKHYIHSCDANTDGTLFSPSSQPTYTPYLSCRLLPCICSVSIIETGISKPMSNPSDSVSCSLAQLPQTGVIAPHAELLQNCHISQIEWKALKGKGRARSPLQVTLARSLAKA